MDTSGSLEQHVGSKPPTDPYKLRIDALRQILKWLQGTNSNVGLITFDTIAEPYENTFRLCDRDFDTNVFPDYVRNKKLGLWTDISLALEEGIEFFNINSGMNTKIPNLIVLFTDGVLALKTKTEEDAAKKKIEQLAVAAKNKNILIAVIALNDGGNSDLEKLNFLKNIANMDLFYEVKSASGLWEQFDQLHSTLFSSYKKTLNPDGKDTFIVPYFGEPVFTFTFLANSSEDNFELKSPDGRVFHKNNIEQMGDVSKSGYTTIVTIKNPAYGTWVSEISARGATANVSINGEWLSRILNYFFIPWVGYVFSVSISGIFNYALRKFLDTLELFKNMKKFNLVIVLIALPLIAFILAKYIFRSI